MTAFEHYAPGVVIARGAVAPQRCDKIVRGLRSVPDRFREPWRGDKRHPRFDYRYPPAPGFVATQHRLVRAAAAALDQPCNSPQTVVSLYQVGVQLEWHRDNPICSCAYSLLLNDPAEYEGGRLFVEDSTNAKSRRPVDMGKGDLIAFTSAVEHMVTAVEAGERWVALGFAFAKPLLPSFGRREDAPGDALTLDERAQLARAT